MDASNSSRCHHHPTPAQSIVESPPPLEHPAEPQHTHSLRRPGIPSQRPSTKPRAPFLASLVKRIKHVSSRRLQECCLGFDMRITAPHVRPAHQLQCARQLRCRSAKDGYSTADQSLAELGRSQSTKDWSKVLHCTPIAMWAAHESGRRARVSNPKCARVGRRCALVQTVGAPATLVGSGAI